MSKTGEVKKVLTKPHSISFKSVVRWQTDVAICNLPKIDGALCIQPSVLTNLRNGWRQNLLKRNQLQRQTFFFFFFENIYQQGYMKIQIDNQEKELLTKELFIQYVSKIFRKNSIFYPLRTHTCPSMRVSMRVIFPENFWCVLNGWSLSSLLRQLQCKSTQMQTPKRIH